MNKYELLKVGTDAETFLTRRGLPVVAIGMFGGTKLEPKPIARLGEGFFIQEDNVMPEFNIPPADNEESFSISIGQVIQWLTNEALNKNCRVSIVPSMTFTAKQLDHPQAQEIGCEPDRNVWQRIINPSPKENPLMRTLRTAAAHVHVSFLVNGKVPDSIELKEPVVKALDITLGLPSLLLDKDTKRRELYGKAGAFRPKDYGIEHRVMSNYWIATPALRKWTFRGVQKAIELINEKDGKLFPAILKEYGSSIEAIINTANIRDASLLLAALHLHDRLSV